MTTLIKTITDALGNIILPRTRAEAVTLEDGVTTIQDVVDTADAHYDNTSNPHSTTAVQVGADPTGTASTAVSNHVAASDPHTQYLKENPTASEVGSLPIPDAGNYFARDTIDGAFQQLGKETSALEVPLANTSVIYSTGTGKDTGGTAQDYSAITNGMVDEVISGNTLQNLVTNGDFSNGTTGWTAFNSVLSANANTLSAVGNGINLSIGTRCLSAMTIGNIYYLRAKVRVRDSVSSKIGIGSGSFLKEQLTPVQDAWYALSNRGTATQNDFYIYSRYADAATANGKVMEVKDVIALDLTALGMESYTVAELDAMTPAYLSSLQSTLNPKVTSVGKNLVSNDSSKYSLSAYAVIGTLPTGISIKNTIADAFSKAIYSLKLNPNMTYTIRRTITLRTGDSTFTGYISVSDTLGKSYLDWGANDSSSSKTFTTGFLTTYNIHIFCTGSTSMLADADITNFQLELGSTATTYEPYKSTSLTANTTLRRVPNGVADTVEKIDGVWKKVKRVEQYTLASADTVSMVISYVNIDYALVKRSALTGWLYATVGSGSSQSILHSTFQTIISDWDNVSNIGKIAVTTDNTYMWVGVAKGTALATAQASIAGTQIFYQLATPVIEDIDVDGELEVFPKGTIYVENADGLTSTFAVPKTTITYPLSVKSMVVKNADEIASIAKIYDARIDALEANQPIFGVKFLNASSDPAGIRTNQSVGKTATAGIGSAGTSSFNGEAIYNLKLCNRASGAVTAYYGEPSFSRANDTFVEIPKGYYRVWNDGTYTNYQISATPFSGSRLHPAFTHNNVIQDYVYIGAYMSSYDGASKHETKSGMLPDNNISRTTARTRSKSRGSYAILQDVQIRDWLNLLMMVEFATRDMQTAIGLGYCDMPYAATHDAVVAETAVNRIIIANAFADLYVVGQEISIGTSEGNNSIAADRTVTSIGVYDGSNKAITFDGAAVNIAIGNNVWSSRQKNGKCDSIGQGTGRAPGTTGKTSVIYRGIENLWGNIWEWVDNLNIRNNQGYTDIEGRIANYNDTDFGTVYSALSAAFPATNNYMVTPLIDSVSGLSCLPATVGGSSSSYFCDYYYQASGDRAAFVGGDLIFGSADGPWFWFLDGAASSAGWYIGARLLEI